MATDSLNAEAPVPGRSCRGCTLCCRLPDIDALDKPADEWCRHCIAGSGCAIYESRPQLCRDFLCLWMTDPELDDMWAPARSHMMVYRQGNQVTILADPDFPDLWRQPPYNAAIRTMADHAARSGGYVILFWRDEVVKI